MLPGNLYIFIWPDGAYLYIQWIFLSLQCFVFYQEFNKQHFKGTEMTKICYFIGHSFFGKKLAKLYNYRVFLKSESKEIFFGQNKSADFPH